MATMTLLKPTTARKRYSCAICNVAIDPGTVYYRDDPRVHESLRGHRARHLCVDCVGAGYTPPRRTRRPAHEGPLPYVTIGDGDVYHPVGDPPAEHPTEVEFLEVEFPGLWVPPRSEHVLLVRHETERIFEMVAQAGDINAVTERQLEGLLAETLHREGFEAWLTPPSADGGRDVIAWRDGHLPILLVGETKKMQLVDPSYMRSLGGVLYRDKANMALLATTGRFSDKTRVEATCGWRRQIALKDGNEFVAWIRDIARRGK